VTSDKFLPDLPATRAEVAYVLANVLGLEKADDITFPDWDTVADAMKEKVASAVSAGLIKGYEDGTIRGEGSVTRAECAALIVRAKGYKAPDAEKPDTSTLGNVLLGEFISKDVASKTVLEIAEELIQSPSILFAGGAISVEEGYLAGFDDYEVKGFKSGAVFMPMIGSIPFVGYVFELEDGKDADTFINNLKDNANLRWNICVMADEMVAGSKDNKVFFVMCPSSLEENPEEEPEDFPQELPEETPEEKPSEKPETPSDKDHLYTLYPLKDLLLIKSVGTSVGENGEEIRKITYYVAGDEENIYTSSVSIDAEVNVVGTKNSLDALAPGDVFVIDTAFLGYISTIVVVASFDEPTPPISIPTNLTYGAGGKYEFWAGTVTSYETKTNTVIFDVFDGTSTMEIIVRKSTPVSASFKKGSSHYWEPDSLSAIEEGSFAFFRFTDDVVTDVIVKN